MQTKQEALKQRSFERSGMLKMFCIISTLKGAQQHFACALWQFISFILSKETKSKTGHTMKVNFYFPTLC